MKEESNKGIVPRSPVVGIFGHIDHGKSTLLDYIRKTNITEKEAGGITQHISAYEVTHTDEKKAERKITFLDTPGHEAFKAMRSRGASAADIGILVVSAEDGVKLQTIEALSAITDAKIPYIVAINKIDKPGANVERTKQTLLEAGIYIEGYGGAVPAVAISAKTGEGIPALLDMILLVAELENLTADSSKKATGLIIESNLDPKRGIAATLIIKDGTLSKGDFVIAGESFAPVRIFENFLGKAIDSATFSSPVRITGWSALPQVGEKFETVENKKEAEVLSLERKNGAKHGGEEFITPQGAAVIPIVIKADVLGSAEAIIYEIKKLETDKVKVKVVESGAGGVSENDVKLLTGATGGIVIAFNVKVDARATELGERQGVAIQTFTIIYKLTEWLQTVITERTPKSEMQEIHGKLKVLKTFSRTKDKQVIGGRVESGKIAVRDVIKIMRRDAEIGKGEIVELQARKVKTSEVEEGNECGLQVETRVEIAAGDVLESFVLVVK